MQSFSSTIGGIIKRKQNGLTLIEVLMCLAILGIITVLSQANFQASRQKNELDVLVDSIGSVIRLAKLQAISHGDVVVLTPLNTTHDWSDGIAMQFSRTHEIVSQWAWNLHYWHISWNGAGGLNEIHINPNLASSVSNGTFTLVNASTKEQVKLVVNRIGRVAVVDS